MSDSTISRIESCLIHLREGRADASKDLIALAYDRLRHLARQTFKTNDRMEGVVDPTELVNASYKRIINTIEKVKPTSAAHFLALGALMIRQELIDMARSEFGRGKKRRRSTINGEGVFEEIRGKDDSPSEVLARDQFFKAVCQKVKTFSADERRLFFLKSFKKVSTLEVAKRLNVHEDTIKRKWREIRIELFDTIESCLVGQELSKVSSALRLDAFQVVEAELLQGYWQELDDKLETLSSEEREFVDMLGWWGLSATEAASFLGIGEQTVINKWSDLQGKLPGVLLDLLGL